MEGHRIFGPCLLYPCFPDPRRAQSSVSDIWTSCTICMYIYIYICKCLTKASKCVCLTKASKLRWKLSKARTSLSICSPTGKLREAVSLKSSCTSFRVVWLRSPTVRWGAQSQVSILALRILNVVQKHCCVIKQPWRLRSVSLNLLKLRRQLK